jgi:hypothetical protein
MAVSKIKNILVSLFPQPEVGRLGVLLSWGESDGIVGARRPTDPTTETASRIDIDLAQR